MPDLRRFIDDVETIVMRHALGEPGAFARWTLPGEPPRHAGPDPYGSADAANLLYTIGRFPRDTATREGFVAALRGMQDPETGLWSEDTHHPIHTTAHCLAALELFDAGPRHPLHDLSFSEPAGALEAFLDALDWKGNPWIESHRGAGIFAARVLADEASPAWQARAFAWLADQCDPETGLWRKGCMPTSPDFLFPHLAGTFHYLFNHEHARRPHPHPAALVDTCLEIEAGGLFPFHRFVGFAEIDWVYCLTRSLRQCGHRFDESRAALTRFAEGHVAFLEGLDPATDPGLDDLHSLFGAVCALAELQTALPGLLETERPLKLVLDRRPFV